MEGGSTSTCAYDELESIILNGSSGPCSIPLEYLRMITNNFSGERLLGEGGFGKVYKGVLKNGKMVAVKRLDQLLKPEVLERQFENEVYHLMRLKHPNIVCFLGYCYETRNECVLHDGKYIFAEVQQKLICLEYLANGSLDGHLSDESSGHEWHTRYKIIKGICYGLLYLHEECQCEFSASIIHLDLKPGNILLDEYMGSKIADFGLSRLFQDNKTQTCATFLSGSLGYMAPEYLIGRIVSTKADIYNLGVIIIEIITGSKVSIFSFSSPTSCQEFVDRVINNWRNRLGGASSETDCKQIKLCLEIGLGCIKFNREERPTSREIIERLDRWETTNCNVNSEERPLTHTEEKASVSTNGNESIVSAVRSSITGSRRTAAVDDNSNINTGTGLTSYGSRARGFFHRQLLRVMRLLSCLCLLLLSCLCLRWQRKLRPSSSTLELDIDGLEMGNVLEDVEGSHHHHPGHVIESPLPPKSPTEKFTFAQIEAATKGFSSKIGEGRFSTVYRGYLPDGREVVIKHRKSGPRAYGSLLHDSKFLSEVALLSRLRHKHLVNLVGYCVDTQNPLFIWEYMNNGSLYGHLHLEAEPSNSSPSSLVMSSWKLRIKILLDASRGIEYLHSYAVPPIIHRDIKSANILLDDNWIARVSDCDLSLTESDAQNTDVVAGTFGYMDPEYCRLQHLTVKSDVYSFGVVMLEVLTGKPAILWDAEVASRLSVVDYAVPIIISGELGKVLDPRVPQLAAHEAKAVELVAYTAVHCIRLERKDRPAMADIVANLKTAFALCEGNFDGDLVKSSGAGGELFDVGSGRGEFDVEGGGGGGGGGEFDVVRGGDDLCIVTPGCYRDGHPLPVRDPTEEFTFAQMEAATMGFSVEAKIGEGSSGTVYRGYLPDGREVAIKRGESGPRYGRQFHESEFVAEMAFLSRLRHIHLVGLVGYCVEKKERLVVCEYMKNGALYDHLHPKAEPSESSPSSLVMSSWKLRIKILLDASRGIEYLHSYAVPPTLHRDIKSSNILQDDSWRARVSGFELSLMESKAKNIVGVAGTRGYMDPDLYRLHHLSVKCDVYGFGVVMLEVLTGKAWSASPMSVVDYAVPSIISGELGKVLDPRVPKPAAHEAQALGLVAYIALHCVRLQDRPAMAGIVANLQTAFALCEGNFDGDLVKSSSSDSPPHAN